VGVQEDLEPYRTLRECPTCKGERLKPESLAVRVKGRGIAEYVNLPISEALEVFESSSSPIAKRSLPRACCVRFGSVSRSCTKSASAT
jgi:excinuclease ABC subunit A